MFRHRIDYRRRVRLQIDLSPELLRKTREAAEKSGVTMSQLVVAMLREKLSERK